MDADFSIELGKDDPVLDFPWSDPAATLAYVDAKRHPEHLARIAEATRYPGLGDALRLLNSARSAVETAKCDAWLTSEMDPDEDEYDATHKFASYIDFVFSDENGDSPMLQHSFSAHEKFAREFVALLKLAPEISSRVEVCVRRCYFTNDGNVREGLYFTLYAFGYGNDDATARLNWEVALKLAANAVLQLSAQRLWTNE